MLNTYTFRSPIRCRITRLCLVVLANAQMFHCACVSCTPMCQCYVRNTSVCWCIHTAHTPSCTYTRCTCEHHNMGEQAWEDTAKRWISMCSMHDQHAGCSTYAHSKDIPLCCEVYSRDDPELHPRECTLVQVHLRFIPLPYLYPVRYRLICTPCTLCTHGICMCS